jgi:predicted nucleic acid-binding protein
MVLVDTSVWIDFFRGVNSPEAGRLTAAIMAETDLCICGLVQTEILQGIKSDAQYKQVKMFLRDLVYLPTPKSGYLLAADIYRAARKKGKTIRNSIDCLIAACAIINKVPLLQKDRDYLTIAAVSDLKLLTT